MQQLQDYGAILSRFRFQGLAAAGGVVSFLKHANVFAAGTWLIYV
jgi:hypothetical protein